MGCLCVLRDICLACSMSIYAVVMLLATLQLHELVILRALSGVLLSLGCINFLVRRIICELAGIMCKQ